MTNETPQAPRGWYPDPAGTPQWRWWDGATWTNDLHPYVQQVTPVTGSLDDEHHAAQMLLRVGLVLVGASVVLQAISRVLDIDQLQDEWRWISEVYNRLQHATSTTKLPPFPTATHGVTALSGLGTLASLGALILILVFQHRSATVAKSLGITSSVSPTFGVVGWFVPLLSFVVPLLAWRGLLPPGHRSRSTMTVIWLSYLASQVASVVCIPVAHVSGFAVGVLSAFQVVAIFICIRLAPDVISAITEEHRIASGSGPLAGHDGLRDI